MGAGNVRAGGFYFAPIGNLLESPENGCGFAATIILASGHQIVALQRQASQPFA
jgi:hypothetical protein